MAGADESKVERKIGEKNNTSPTEKKYFCTQVCNEDYSHLNGGTVYIFPSEISVDLLKEKRDSQAAGDLLDYMVTSGHNGSEMYGNHHMGSIYEKLLV